jgi:hypothetical protein
VFGVDPERQPLQPIGQQPKLRVRALCGKVIDDRLNRVAVAQCGIQQQLLIGNPQGGRFILEALVA